MADLTLIRVRDVRFPVEDNRIQWRLKQWRTDPTLADLDCLTVSGLYCIPGLGKRSVNAIVETLAKFRNA